MNLRGYLISGAAIVLVLALAAPLPGASLLANDFTNVGSIYDINAATGQTTNPRATGIFAPIGIATAPDGVLYGVNADTVQSKLYVVTPSTGTATLVGGIGLALVEGDLTFDPSGVLYATARAGGGPGNGNGLVTIDRTSGVGTLRGTIPSAEDISGLAWRNGNLYALDVRPLSQDAMRLYTLNPADAAILTTTMLNINGSSASSAALAGLAVNPDNGTLYLAAGSSPSTLYTVNTTSGVCTPIGMLAAAGSVAGLAFIPEPTSASLLLLPIATLFGRRRRQPCGEERK